jgi:hypothetical protein
LILIRTIETPGIDKSHNLLKLIVNLSDLGIDSLSKKKSGKDWQSGERRIATSEKWNPRMNSF